MERIRGKKNNNGKVEYWGNFGAIAATTLPAAFAAATRAWATLYMYPSLYRMHFEFLEAFQNQKAAIRKLFSLLPINERSRRTGTFGAGVHAQMPPKFC